MTSAIKNNILEAVTSAMRAKDKARLGALRLVMAALKQKEVDERIELSDADVLSVLDKMLKQRRDSLTHFQAAHRQDLIDQETLEIAIIENFLPSGLSDAEVRQIIQAGIATVGAHSISDMGKVMALVKPQLQGRTDIGLASLILKKMLT